MDREGLSDFLDGGEGAPPPVFVGRGEILKRTESCAAQAWKGSGAESHGHPKMSQIIQGAPGAGKSATMHELMRRARIERKGADGQSRVVILSSEMLLTDLAGVIETVAVAGGLSRNDWVLMSSRVSASLDLKAVEATAEAGWRRPEDIRRPASLQHLARNFRSERWRGPVIVCVDEAQNLPRARHEPHALFLQSIHGGLSGLPLSLVLGGLGDTSDVAIGMGLTRPDNVWPLGRLSPNEAFYLVLSFCDEFGLDAHGCEERLATLTDPCEGWPRHLHHALRALAEQALEHDGHLGACDWDRIQARTMGMRLRYYGFRQSSAMRRSNVLIAHVLKCLKDGMNESRVLGLIEESEEDEAGRRLPKGMDAEGFMDHLVHQGALEKSVDDAPSLRCPIPSFRTYLIRAGGLEPDADPDPSPTSTKDDGLHLSS